MTPAYTPGSDLAEETRPPANGTRSRTPFPDRRVKAEVLRELINGIRNGRLINDLRQVAHSTPTAIMGRMSAYTVTWEQALNAKGTIVPTNLAMDMNLPVPPVAIPGSQG